MNLWARFTDDILNMNGRIEGFRYRLGRWSEAYEIQIFHFTKIEVMLGRERPSTLTSMNVLSRQCNYEEAERIYRQALALIERVLGKEHPDTLTSVYCLAYLLYQQEQYKDAELFYYQSIRWI